MRRGNRQLAPTMEIECLGDAGPACFVVANFANAMNQAQSVLGLKKVQSSWLTKNLHVLGGPQVARLSLSSEVDA